MNTYLTWSKSRRPSGWFLHSKLCYVSQIKHTFNLSCCIISYYSILIYSIINTLSILEIILKQTILEHIASHRREKQARNKAVFFHVGRWLHQENAAIFTFGFLFLLARLFELVSKSCSYIILSSVDNLYDKDFSDYFRCTDNCILYFQSTMYRIHFLHL